MTKSFQQDAIVLFGDSLTQDISDGSLAPLLTSVYVRKLDVVNRGFGGYNTDWALPIFDGIFRKQDDCEGLQKVKLLTIWFGTNDAVIGSKRGVPLDKYTANINHFVSSLASPASDYYQPEAQILLITPQPFVQAMRDQAGNKVKLDLEHTRRYKDTCLAIGREWNEKTSGKVQILDYWKLLVDAAGDETDEALRPYFVDGVHLSTKAYRLLFDEIMRIIRSRWSHLDPEKMKMTVPRYEDATDSWDWYHPLPPSRRVRQSAEVKLKNSAGFALGKDAR